MSDSTYTFLLIQGATVYRKTLGVVDSFGVPTEVVTTIGTIPCLIQPLDTDLEISVHGKKEIGRDVVFVEFTANILVDDIIEINSKKYGVLSVDDPAGTGHHRELIVKRM